MKSNFANDWNSQNFAFSSAVNPHRNHSMSNPPKPNKKIHWKVWWQTNLDKQLTVSPVVEDGSAAPWLLAAFSELAHFVDITSGKKATGKLRKKNDLMGKVLVTHLSHLI